MMAILDMADYAYVFLTRGVVPFAGIRHVVDLQTRTGQIAFSIKLLMIGPLLLFAASLLSPAPHVWPVQGVSHWPIASGKGVSLSSSLPSSIRIGRKGSVVCAAGWTCVR